MSESDTIVQVCLVWLIAQPGLMAWPQNTGGARFIRADGSSRLVRFPRKGTPDILGCLRGRGFGIECKLHKNCVSADQRNWRDAWERAGGLYVAAWTLEDVQRAFAVEGYV